MITNIKILNLIKSIKEHFNLFFFYPLMLSLIAIAVLTVFEFLNLWTFFFSYLILNVIYVFLWFFWFGKPPKKFHRGDD